MTGDPALDLMLIVLGGMLLGLVGMWGFFIGEDRGWW